MAPRKVLIAAQLAILSVVITTMIFYHDLIAQRFIQAKQPSQHIGYPAYKSNGKSSFGDFPNNETASDDKNKTAQEPTEAAQKVLNTTAPYVKAIMDPTDKEFSRLECPTLNLSRYDVLKEVHPPSIQYFFALDLRQCVKLLPRLLGSIVEAINFLGSQSCALSIVEGNSDDGTPEVLEIIRGEIEALGTLYYYQTSDIDPSKGERIAKLAKLRNLALQPLLDNETQFSGNSTVIFLNDVAICVEDILELVYQRQRLDADMACAMDWTYVGQDPTFYDIWIARTISGDTFFEIPADGNWNAPWNLFWNSLDTKSRYNQHLPFQVFSCWNGAAIFTAAPFVEKAVSFRGPAKDECFQGEPQLFCKDMWFNGYGRIAVVPSVNLEYSDERGKDIKMLKGYTSNLVQTGEFDRIVWETSPPERVKCMESYASQEWRPWNETLDRE